MANNFTPEEIAAKTWQGGITESEVYDFFKRASLEDMQKFFSRLPTGDHSHWFHKGKVALNIKIANQQAESAKMLIDHTEKLTNQTDLMLVESKNLGSLTKVLIWLTFALGVFAVIQIILMICDIWKHK